MNELKCKVRGCKNPRWQRPSGLPNVLCNKHASIVARSIPTLLDKVAKNI